jgi:hypothetical protein
MKLGESMMVLFRRLTPPAIALACFAVMPAYAACTKPAGNEQDFIYNGDYRSYQFCNGTNWIVAGGTLAPEVFTAQTIGDTAIEGGADNNNANLIMTQEAPLPYASVIRSLSVYVNTAAGHLRLGIYDATGSGGNAGTLMATTNSFVPTTGWNTANVVTPVTLAAGYYWLAWATDSNSANVAGTGNSGTQNDYSHTYGAFPSTLGAVSNTYVNTDSNYATFTAGCVSPAGKERDIIYNAASHTYQFCNGAFWIPFGGNVPSGGGGGCFSPPGVERDIIYNGGTNHTYQFCNGTNWVKYGGGMWQGKSAGAGNGYFVMSKNQWNGNLGGAAGADAKCLTELTTYNWKGYAEANARGILTSGKVHAWICDGEGIGGGTGCNNLNANTTYYFANANDSTKGGNRFTTDGNGVGPGDLADWSQASYFGGSYTYWSGRYQGTDTAWSLNLWSTNVTCDNDWSVGTNDGTGSGYGIAGNGGANRWFNGPGPTCNQTENLICYVNP